MHQSSKKLTWSHSRSTRPWKPLMVLQTGSSMIWAKAVTCRVESVPSVPWTSTEAPSLKQTRTVCQHASPVHSLKETRVQNLSMHWAARQAVVRISLTWVCQLDASNLLNQRSMLCDWSLQASTSLIRLSWRTLYLKTTNISQRSLKIWQSFNLRNNLHKIYCFNAEN